MSGQGQDEWKRRHGNIDVYTVKALQDNYVFILHEWKNNKVAVVDPGEAKPVSDKLQALGLPLDCILTTHHHWDHTDGNLALKSQFDCKVYGFGGDKGRIPGITDELREGSQLEFGGEPVEIFQTDGHTVGHICFYFPQSKMAFVGDTLFVMGCGRLFEGTPKQMHESLQKLAANLPENTTVYCAHEYTMSNAKFAVTVDSSNEDLRERYREIESLRAQDRKTVPTTMEMELKTNPFLRCGDPDLKSCIGMESEQDEGKVFARVRELKDNF
ncbi:hydroxyacylglutathione hydrolase [Chloropicon primus]|uniref:hydroxyacylglutathione hydrolase n=2 Tax=Chloropicon primus TaxID=1764295 RepID=A0A5B8MNR3_9CHLO|nr:hydroxyacylglutathione hydrolase [Chloropicon primus]UPR01171.1 hydroxyacylglutathione hydrolase [Chloropicon primus]|eukprot:QDZ21951.1 hydroxyacylglutathione hydrolase [Chloropicon primus]